MIPAADRAMGAFMAALGIAGAAILLRLSFTTNVVTGVMCTTLALFGVGVGLMGLDLATGLAMSGHGRRGRSAS